MSQVMLDIEALGRHPGCVVTEVGLYEFTGAIHRKQLVCFDLEDSLRRLTIEGPTLNWWATQPGFGVMVSRQPRVGLRKGCRQIAAWCEAVQANRVWANGATFDFPILEAAFRAAGVKLPWHYRDVRDTRFLRDLTWQPAATQFVGTEHNALDDAEYQGKVLCKYLEKLQEVGLYDWEAITDSGRPGS